MNAVSENPVTLSLVKSRYNENYIPLINGSIFETNRSVTLFDNVHAEYLKKRNTFFVIVGTDSGLLIDYVVKNIDTGSVYIFVDFPEVIEFLQKSELVPELPDNVILTEPDGWLELADKHEFQNYVYMNSNIVLHSYASIDANLTEYMELTRRIEDEFHMLKFRTEVHYGKHEYIKIQLEDVCENVIPAIYLKKQFSGKTAVVLAGGPSVVDSFSWIKENRDNILLIAVSRIARVLKDADIVPDFFISLDPYKENLATSEGLLDFSDVLLVNGNHLEPRLLSQWEGRSMYLGMRFPWETELNHLGNIQLPGPTVANTAIHIAMELGCHRIYLSGVDLCFSSEGYTHVKGTKEHDAGPNVGFTGRRVVTYNDEYAVTIPAFDMARSTFEEQASAAKKIGISIYNLNINAAYIPGIEYTDLGSIVTNEKFSARQILDQIYKDKSVDTSYLLKDTADVLDELYKAKNDFHEMKDLCNSALEYNEKMYSKYDVKNFRKFKKKLDSIEEQLETEFGGKANLIQNYGFLRFAKFVRPENYDWTPEEMQEVGRIYYEAYRTSLDDMLSLIDSTISRTLNRMEEHKDNPDFEQIATQWRKDKQPGRVRVWCKYHPDKLNALSVESREEISSLEKEYEVLMDETREWWANSLKTERDTSDVKSKMWNLFRRGDLDQLIVLRSALESKSEEQNFIDMLSGMIAELENNMDSAYRCYKKVVENSEDFMILQRKAYCELVLNKFDDALATMKELSDSIPYFKTRYAELLKALGKTQECIDQYTEYLQHSPDDYTSFIRLGEIYKELGISEGVDWISSYVLSKEPENEAAKQLRQNE